MGNEFGLIMAGVVLAYLIYAIVKTFKKNNNGRRKERKTNGSFFVVPIYCVCIPDNVRMFTKNKIYNTDTARFCLCE